MIEPNQNLQVIERLDKEFYYLAQEIIEQNYLQPLTLDGGGAQLTEKTKVNLKDGDLERPLHGGMHVGRAQFWALIWYKKIQEMFPVYTKSVFSELSEMLNLNEQHILTLVRYAVLFHDSARKNEFSENYNEESAKKCYDFFVQQGVSTNLSELISHALIFKNYAGKYAKFLQSKGLNQGITGLEFIRKLIFISDHQDSMRCENVYELNGILKEFNDISEFQLNIHLETIIETTKHIRAIIVKQKDMLFSCVIALPNGTRLNFGDRKIFDLNSKVAIEHANNVCSVIGALIKNDQYFKQYLAKEKLLNTELAQVTAVFNPYIHGTNSFILPMLKRTEFAMVSPVQMLREYGMAPMSGELDKWQGGVGLEDLGQQEYICFGKVFSRGEREYNLGRVSNCYTKHSVPTKGDTISMVQTYADTTVNRGGEDINKLLIHYVRAKLLGVEPLSKENYTKLLAQLNGLIQFYYFLMLLGKHVHPNFDLYSKAKQALRDVVTDSPEMRLKFQEKTKFFGSDDEFTFDGFMEYEKKYANIIPDAICTHLTYENMVNKIIDLKLDIKHIYENPTEENLRKALSILELPKKSIIKTGAVLHIKKEITLSDTQFFTLNKPVYANVKDFYKPADLYMLVKNDGNENVDKFLSNCFYEPPRVTEKTFKKFENVLLKRIAILTKKMDLLEKIAANNPEDVKLSPQEMDFMRNPFPVIMVCTAEEKMTLIDTYTQEYRVYEPLKLGADIKMIATDTRQHQLLIMKFIKENHINNVQVVLIDQLLTNKSNDEKSPKSLYTHADGFSRLSFFAAKVVPGNVIPKDQQSKELIEAAREYEDIKLFS